MRVGFSFAVDVVDFGGSKYMHLAATNDAAELDDCIHPRFLDASCSSTLQRALAAHRR